MSVGYQWERMGILAKELADVIERIASNDTRISSQTREALMNEREGVLILARWGARQGAEHAELLEREQCERSNEP